MKSKNTEKKLVLFLPWTKQTKRQIIKIFIFVEIFVCPNSYKVSNVVGEKTDQTKCVFFFLACQISMQPNTQYIFHVTVNLYIKRDW